MSNQREYFFFSKVSEGRYAVTSALGIRLGQVEKVYPARLQARSQFVWKIVGTDESRPTRQGAALRLREIKGAK